MFNETKNNTINVIKANNMGILDTIPTPRHDFKNNAVVTPKDETEKLETILELQNMGYNGEYMNWQNNIGGCNIVVSVGLWHCTDSDAYKNNKTFIDCGSDIAKFLEVSLQKRKN